MTYDPSADRILPSPTELYVKVRNTSAIPLRAAYLHGPYTLYTSCYPSTYDPNQKHDDQKDGLPQYEPNLKAGGSWDAVIHIPEEIRVGSLATGVSPNRSMTWIIEVVSQVIFSNTAAVHYEVVVGRDEKSVELGANAASGLPAPGHLRDHARHETRARKGVYSEAVKLVVNDTASLWSTPRFPSFQEKNDLGQLEAKQSNTTTATSATNTEPSRSEEDESAPKRREKVHLVILTHGLHSNLGADMLYVKESIDAAAKKASEDRRKSRADNRRSSTIDPDSGGSQSLERDNPQNSEQSPEDEEEERVIVRGFPGNAARTERGIQYLGKRLARYVLLMTYPDQPYLPVKTTHKPFMRPFTGNGRGSEQAGHASHSGSTIHRQEQHHNDSAYRITSISFVGHSLGGLIQTYAIAYIQKHSPEFFDRIKPINFVTLASPLLGLSNENPIYVRFALEFGLVGRTGQDLGLAWSAPSKMRNGWGAMIGGLGNDAQNPQRQPDPGSKPLLRILPTGPAHQVLKKFRNRTVYSNVVNDGIVPLRTSCLLFLDWKGLDRVEKARRENGLVGTMAEWGWAEITGANSTSTRTHRHVVQSSPDTRDSKPTNSPSTAATNTSPDPSKDNSNASASKVTDHPTQHSEAEQSVAKPQPVEQHSPPLNPKSQDPPSHTPSSPFSSLFSMFRPQGKSNQGGRSSRIYKRSQTLHISQTEDFTDDHTESGDSNKPSANDDAASHDDEHYVPPRTTILESASDLLNPPLPPTDFLLDPSARPRTIFHDRVYHPSDIPLPQPAKPRTFFHSNNSSRSSSANRTNNTPNSIPTTELHAGPTSGMKVEEKIARAYHRDLSWRKVLVLLEPDAHNNIIVRRMFSNAYGWPVVKHLADTHFGYTRSAEMADEFEKGNDRAWPAGFASSGVGEEVAGQLDTPDTVNEHRPTGRKFEDETSVPSTPTNKNIKGSNELNADGKTETEAQGDASGTSPQGSATWTDRYFEDDRDYDSHEEEQFYTTARRFNDLSVDNSVGSLDEGSHRGERGDNVQGTSDAEIADFLSGSASSRPRPD